MSCDLIAQAWCVSSEIAGADAVRRRGKDSQLARCRAAAFLTRPGQHHAGPFAAPRRGRLAPAPCGSRGRRSAWRCRWRGSSPMTRQISTTISGARPSVASSRMISSRMRHQRAADRQHLLFAARELRAQVVEALAQARKGLQHAFERPVVAAVAAAARGHHQVFAHRQVREHAAAFGHIGHAGTRHVVRPGLATCPGRRSRCGRRAASHGRAGCGSACSCPCRCGPSRPTVSPRADLQVDAVQHVARAVPGVHAARHRG